MLCFITLHITEGSHITLLSEKNDLINSYVFKTHLIEIMNISEYTNFIYISLKKNVLFANNFLFDHNSEFLHILVSLL